MPIEIDATYENEMLKPDAPLALPEHERVRVVVKSCKSTVRELYGIVGWHGDAEVVRQIALDPEFGIAPGLNCAPSGS